jgi:electron transfer flavoprotein beta subunit
MIMAVLVKQVPNTNNVRIDPKTGNLVREGVEGVMNPEDRHALEAALRIRDDVGGTVCAISMGPPQAVETLCEALAMGADRAVLLSDRAFAGADTWATSTTLGHAIRKLGHCDLVLAGRQAVDGDTAQIGPQVAEFLGIPQLTYVTKLEITGDGASIVVERKLESGCERVEAPLPALVTVLGSLNEPRFPTVGGILDAVAERAPVELWSPADLGLKVHDVGLPGSLTQVVRTFTPKEKRNAVVLEGSPASIAQRLLEELRLKEIRLGE